MQESAHIQREGRLAEIVAMGPSFAICADENDAYPGLRVWHIALDPSGHVTVRVTWKTVSANVIQHVDVRQILLMSETADVFASVILHEAEDLVGELMRPHVWNRLSRDIVQWYGDNLAAIHELKGSDQPVHGSPIPQS